MTELKAAPTTTTTATPAAPAPPTPDEVASKKAGEILAQQDADAAHVPTQVGTFKMSTKGDEFLIEGSGFGGHQGTVTIGGRSVPLTMWHDSRIAGVLPSDVTGGDVVISGDTGVFKGPFGK